MRRPGRSPIGSLRTAAAAEVWLARRGVHDFRDLRFDAVLVVIPAAFEAGRCGKRIAWRGARISRTAWSSPPNVFPENPCP
jgi:hypothetical protein